MLKNKIHSIVFFDLDGTLYDERGKVPDELFPELKTMESRGILPVISSGRSPFEIKETIEQTGIYSMVCMTGGYVTVAGEVVYKSVLSVDLIKDFLEDVNLKNTPVAFYNKYENIISNFHTNVGLTYKHIHSSIPRIDSEYYLNNEINMMLIFSQNEMETLQDKYKKQLSFYRNVPYAMDITASGVSKATGLKKIMDYFDKDVTTYAFGDGKNDIPMSNVVDHFIAMGNGAAEVKSIADYVTTDNSRHGILNGLRHFNLEK